jgi:hypothetical protein
MTDIDPIVVVLGTLLVVFVARSAFALYVSRGRLGRYMQAQRLALRWLRDRDFAAEVDALQAPPGKAPKVNAEPARFLALLQRDGRLLDFLMEDVSAATDSELGAGVREIHRQCQKTLRDHLVLQPVLDQEENTSIEVPAAFNPAAIRLTGNVTGTPPFRGQLIHRGWRIKELKLAPLPKGHDPLVLQPAEVELP